MSTASSRQLERGTSPHAAGSALSTDSARTVGPTLSGSSSSITKGGSTTGTSGLSTSQSPSKARMSSMSSRGGLGSENVTTLSSSGSPPASPLSQSNVKEASSDSSLAAPITVGRSSTTQTKRVISLDDESKDSSISKEGESEDVSDSDTPNSPSIEDPRIVMRTRSSKSSSTSNTSSAHSNSGVNGVIVQTTITTRSLSATPSTTSGSRPPNVPVLQARVLPAISETDSELLGPNYFQHSSSSSTSSKKKRRKHGSQRAMHSNSRQEVSSGYASESTLLRGGGDRSAASTGNLDETGSVSSSHSPTHSRPWPMSNSASTGPISYSSRDRSASRSGGDSPVDPSMLSARSDSVRLTLAKPLFRLHFFFFFFFDIFRLFCPSLASFSEEFMLIFSSSLLGLCINHGFAPPHHLSMLKNRSKSNHAANLILSPRKRFSAAWLFLVHTSFLDMNCINPNAPPSLRHNALPALLWALGNASLLKI